VKWLTKQTPVGVWATQHNGSTITIGFEQGPNEEVKEGIYKQVERTRDGKEIKEFGHWTAHMNNLQMLIMASEIKNHPRFSQDTAYQVLYVGPNSIKITGPDRPNLVYNKAPEGTVLDFDKQVEQSVE
jgi:hypothetical protein